MRKPNDKSRTYDDDAMEKHEQGEDQTRANLLAFPCARVTLQDDGGASHSKVHPYDVAEYIAEMLYSLENLAQQSRLDVLGLMIAMAREQANDDIGGDT